MSVSDFHRTSLWLQTSISLLQPIYFEIVEGDVLLQKFCWTLTALNHLLETLLF